MSHLPFILSTVCFILNFILSISGRFFFFHSFICNQNMVNVILMPCLLILTSAISLWLVLVDSVLHYRLHFPASLLVILYCLINLLIFSSLSLVSYEFHHECVSLNLGEYSCILFWDSVNLKPVWSFQVLHIKYLLSGVITACSPDLNISH